MTPVDEFEEQRKLSVAKARPSVAKRAFRVESFTSANAIDDRTGCGIRASLETACRIW